MHATEKSGGNTLKISDIVNDTFLQVIFSVIFRKKNTSRVSKKANHLNIVQEVQC